MPMIRTQGALPFPIGTSLAFETYLEPINMPYDAERVVPKPPEPLTEAQVIHINVGTLVRNLIGSIDDTYVASEAIKMIVSDMEILKEYISFTTFDTEVRFFVTKLSPKVLIPQVKERLRRHTAARTVTNIKRYNAVMKMVSSLSTVKIHVETDGVEGNGKRGVIFTSYPVDMLKYNSFSKVYLLSSHTGLVKSRDSLYELYVKLPRLDMSIFPFNKWLLGFLGDKPMIKPADITLRRFLYQAAIEHNWTTRTTLEKVKESIRDPKYLSLYTEIFRINR